MVKLVDVAERARVSRGTASNVFTHPELVSEALRERVLKAAAELGYGGPNPTGRLLRLGKVNAIGVTPPGSYGVSVAFSNPYFREFMTGVSEICDERGASITIVSGVGPGLGTAICAALREHGAQLVVGDLDHRAVERVVADHDAVGQVADITDVDACDALVDLADEVKADLLVVGNVGLSTIAGRLLGSVPANVARRSKTDVLIVHTTP